MKLSKIANLAASIVVATALAAPVVTVSAQPSEAAQPCNPKVWKC